MIINISQHLNIISNYRFYLGIKKVGKIPNHTANQLVKSLNKVMKLYGRCGFIIHVILIDM